VEPVGSKPPKGENSRRMRFYRRNFLRMYPNAGEQAKQAVAVQAAKYMRWRKFRQGAVGVAAAAAALVVLWLWAHLVIWGRG